MQFRIIKAVCEDGFYYAQKRRQKTYMIISNTRSPTEEPVKRSKASAAAKKKTYCQRTMQEVKKSLHYVENKYDDQSPENEDPAHKT